MSTMRGRMRPFLDKIRQESRKDRPLVVYVPFRALLGPVELREIREHADIGILNLDDTWRTDLVSLYLNYCDWFTTRIRTTDGGIRDGTG